MVGRDIPERGPDAVSDDDRQALLDDETLPRITRMPEGIEVIEHRVGRATAQWILQIRCQCGRRWFELEEVGMAQCPRCGRLVHVELEGARPVP